MTSTEIKALIDQGSIDEALAALVNIKPNALLLQSQFESAKRNHNLGLIEGDELRRVREAVKKAALSLIGEENPLLEITPAHRSLLDAARFAEMLLAQNTGDALAIQAVQMLRQAIQDSTIQP